MAKDEPVGTVMERWGRSHDLAFAEWYTPEPATPLLRDGVSRAGYDALAGRLRGHPVTLCLYTVAYGESGPVTADFTMVIVEQVSSPADGLALRPHGPPTDEPFPRSGGMRGWRTVELESARMTGLYRLLIAPTTPERAVRQLFEPVVVDWCAEEGDVFFELEQQVLVVTSPGIRTRPDDLDDIWERTDWLLAWIVAHA